MDRDSVSGVPISHEMAEAGLDALARARRLGQSDGDLIAAVYVAMQVASGATAAEDVGCFVREAVLNFRSVMETLHACESRMMEHAAQIAPLSIDGPQVR